MADACVCCLTNGLLLGNHCVSKIWRVCQNRQPRSLGISSSFLYTFHSYILRMGPTSPSQELCLGIGRIYNLQSLQRGMRKEDSLPGSKRMVIAHPALLCHRTSDETLQLAVGLSFPSAKRGCCSVILRSPQDCNHNFVTFINTRYELWASGHFLAASFNAGEDGGDADLGHEKPVIINR